MSKIYQPKEQIAPNTPFLHSLLWYMLRITPSTTYIAANIVSLPKRLHSFISMKSIIFSKSKLDKIFSNFIYHRIHFRNSINSMYYDE